MKRSKGYILTEIMMSMLLQAMFIVVLSGAFYMMLSFYTRTQQLQTARERGFRVISYFDRRIRHAGLGLWQCQNSYQIVKMVSKENGIIASTGVSDTNKYKNLLPVSLISCDGWDKTQLSDYVSKDIVGGNGGKIYMGNILTLLYAYRDFDDTAKWITTAVNFNPQSGTGNETSIFQNSISFNDNTNNTIQRYFSVAEGVGLPLSTGITENDAKFKKASLSYTNISSAPNPVKTVYAGSELLHLNGERMFVVKDKNTPEESSFAFAFSGDSKWNGPYYHVAGILDIYMELRAPTNGTKTFDLYVLSTGGKDSSRTTTQPPATWPGAFSSKYASQVMYVSRASWELNNIPKNFEFKFD